MGTTEEKGKAAAPAEAKSEKRKMLTPEQKVAKLEAELKAAREKAAAKANAEITQLKERRSALVDQISERQAKVRDIDARLKELGVDMGAPVQAAKAG